MNPRQLLATLEAHGVTLAFTEGKLEAMAKAPPPPQLIKAAKRHKDELISLLTVPRLPWQLERLLAAASGDLLLQGTIRLAHGGLVTNLNHYVLSWAATYLTGDRDEALRRLWEAYRTWQGVN